MYAYPAYLAAKWHADLAWERVTQGFDRSDLYAEVRKNAEISDMFTAIANRLYPPPKETPNGR